MFRLQATIIRQTFQYMDITEYVVVFWLNDVSVSTTTQMDGSYKKEEEVHLIYFYKPDSYFQENT